MKARGIDTTNPAKTRISRTSSIRNEPGVWVLGFEVEKQSRQVFMGVGATGNRVSVCNMTETE